MSKHEKAIGDFWAEVNKLPDERAMYRSLMNFFMMKMPTWMVKRAAEWVKEYARG